MDANLANFRAVFPEFDDPVATDVQVEFSIELAREQHRCSENAILYLSAHTLSLTLLEGMGGEGSQENAAVGVVLREKVGDLEVQYSDISKTDTSSDTYYERTPYGRQYLALRNAANKKFSVRVA